jgi:hypothetical protein
MAEKFTQSGFTRAWNRLRYVATGRPNTTVLTARLGTQEIARITYWQAPVEVRTSLPLTSDTLILTDSKGKTNTYDLSSVRRDGATWLHLSIRVSAPFSVLIDCIINNSSSPQERRGKEPVTGMRFQPFYLPECPSDPADLVGRGLFYRGLHFSGWITPGSVSLMCMCDYCAKSFRLQSFHAGFSSQLYFYCDTGTHTLVVPDDIIGAPRLIGRVDPAVIADFDARLPLCDRCGGHFRYANSFRCPHCHQPYIDFARYPDQRTVEYYGNVLYGDQPQTWKPNVD